VSDDDTAVLVHAIERFPSLAPLVTVEREDRYTRVVLALRSGPAEAVWGDGYTRVHGELMRYEGFLTADVLADTFDVLRKMDAIDGRIGRIEEEGECLVRVSAAWTELRARWWSRKKIRQPSLRLEYSQVTWAPGVDPATRVGYTDTYVIDGIREEIDRLEDGRFLTLGNEIAFEWLSAAESEEAVKRFDRTVRSSPTRPEHRPRQSGSGSGLD
jgi:hypothetical protein